MKPRLPRKSKKILKVRFLTYFNYECPRIDQEIIDWNKLF